jgi:sterol desaturase/sphingolipid hydroxylase (fatty acid hydroxylase superfamily)
MQFFPPLWVTPAVVGASFLLMLLSETVRPLRRLVESKRVRVGRNVLVAVPAFALASVLQTLTVFPVAEWAARHRFGLAQIIPLPDAVRMLLAVVLLDYTLWFWHFANHKVPALWRFHLVHHVDRDLDSSTALRFHFGEMALSMPYRAIQILIAGADPLALWLWQALLFISIFFHHSNARLPLGLERLLVKVIVTPRMHGIHHSDRMNEANTNWSSLLSAWDYLHGTVLLDVPQKQVSIGVPAYSVERDVTLGRILALPFKRQRQDWRGASGGDAVRPHDPGSRKAMRA